MQRRWKVACGVAVLAVAALLLILLLNRKGEVPSYRATNVPDHPPDASRAGRGARAKANHSTRAVPVHVSGHVLDTMGRPVSGARVQAFINDRKHLYDDSLWTRACLEPEFSLAAEIHANESGAYTLVLPHVGEYLLVASAKAYGRDVAPRLPLVGDTAPLDFHLILGREVCGIVVDDVGAPVPGAALTTSLGDLPVVTASDGRFRLRLPPGASELRVAAAGFVRAHEDVPYDLTKEMRIVLSKGKTFRFRVVDAKTKAPLSGACLVAYSFHSLAEVLGYRTTGKDGIATFDNLKEEPDVSVWERHHAPTWIDPFSRPHVTGAIERITLDPGLVVRGRVLDAETRRPVAGAEVLFLQRGSMSRPAISAEDGTYTLEGVPPKYASLIAYRQGYALTEKSPLELENVPATQDLVLTPAVPLTGRVLSPAGRPVAGAEVRLHEDMPTRFSGYARILLGHAPGVLTRSDGTFTISWTGPGQKIALIAAHSSFGASKPVTAVAGTPVVLRLQTAVRATGTVVDSTGAPLRGVEISVSWRKTETDQDGHYVFKGLVPGDYTAHYEHEFFWPKQQQFTVYGQDLSLPPVTLARVPPTTKAPSGPIVGKEGYHLKGIVMIHGGKRRALPVAGVKLRLEQRGGVVYTVTNRKGAFDCPSLAQGPVDVTTAPGSKFVTDGTLRFQAGSDVGIIRVSEPEPLEGTVVRADGEAPARPLSIELKRPGSEREQFPVNADGSFHIPGLYPRRYSLQIVLRGTHEVVAEVWNLRTGIRDQVLRLPEAR